MEKIKAWLYNIFGSSNDHFIEDIEDIKDRENIKENEELIFEIQLDNYLENLMDDPIKVWKINDIPTPLAKFINPYMDSDASWLVFIPVRFSDFDNLTGIIETILLKEGTLHLLV